MSEEVGIGELRQNLSRHLQRVKRGERIVVTERNRPVAVLGPLPRDESVVERLIAEGKATRGKGSIADLPPPIKLDGDPYAGSKALDYVRGEG